MAETALVPESEVREIQTQTDKIVAAAQALAVIDDKSMADAADLLGWIAKARKGFEERRKFFVSPMNRQVRKINAMFKGYSEPLEEADGLLRGKVLEYRQEQERIRRAEEERLRRLAEAEQKRLDEEARKEQEALEKQAEEEGIAPPPPLPAPPPMPTPQVQEQAKTVRGDYGNVSAKKVWDYEIVDPAQVPPEFKVVNEKAVRAAVRAGVRNIPGVKIYQREELAVRSF